MASFTPHILLTYKEFTFYNKKHTHTYISYIYHNPFFSEYTFHYLLHLIEDVSLGFNIYHLRSQFFDFAKWA